MTRFADRGTPTIIVPVSSFPTTIRGSRRQRRGIVAAVLLTLMLFAPATALAQEAVVECGEYEGVVCQGFFTDEAGVVDDPARIEDALARVVEEHGSPIAIVVVSDSRGRDPRAFAVALADDWGVGDPVDEDGVLILV